MPKVFVTDIDGTLTDDRRHLYPPRQPHGVSLRATSSAAGDSRSTTSPRCVQPASPWFRQPLPPKLEPVAGIIMDQPYGEGTADALTQYFP